MNVIKGRAPGDKDSVSNIILYSESFKKPELVYEK